MVVSDHASHLMPEVLALARLQTLTVDNVAYLDQAMREGLPLALLYDRQVAAARRCGVALIED